MSVLQKLQNAQKARRIARVRIRVSGTAARPRLAVFRSLAHISAQIIDDSAGKTLLAVNDREIKEKGKKSEIAMILGKILAERALAKGIKQVVFDRRDKKYHGRIKAVAEGARAGGLEF